MRSWMAFLLVLVALSGCSDADDALDEVDAEPAPAPPPAPEDPPEEPPAPEEPAPANRPPTARLEADVTEGTAPLAVTFTLDGDDPDGDALTWTFDKEDDGVIDQQGSELPTELSYTLEAGEHAAVLRVFDGGNETNATVVVTAVAPEAPDADAPAQSLTLAWAVGGTDAYALAPPAGACEPGEGDGTLYAAFEVDPDSLGAPVAATIAHEHGAEAVVTWGVVYYDDDCSRSEPVASDGTDPLRGTVPGFAAWALVYSDGGAGITVSYTAG